MSAPQPVLWASCGATTLAGSVLALLLVQPAAWPGVPLLLVGLAVVVVATGFLATTSGRPAPPRRPAPTAARPGADVWGDKRPGGLFEGDEKPQPRVEPVAAVPPQADGSSPSNDSGPAVHQVLPAGTDWWQVVTAGAGRRGPGPSSPPRSAARAVTDPSSYLDDAVIAQCPECGSMHLDVEVREIGYGFRCRACQKPWTWHPGTPWPAVRLCPGAAPTRPPARPALPEGN